MHESRNGGARHGAGRKPGSKNRVPSKSTLAAQHFADLIAPNLSQYHNVLHSIALDDSEKAVARIAAVKELLDRGLGRSKEIIEISTPDPLPPAADLISAWATVHAAPPIELLGEEALLTLEVPDADEH